MPNDELEGLLKEADTAIESCQRLQEAKARIEEINHYIPQFEDRIRKLDAVDPQGPVLAKLRTKLAALETERSQLRKVIAPAESVRKQVAIVKSKVNLTEALASVESDREARKREYAERMKLSEQIASAILSFKEMLWKHEDGAPIDPAKFREYVERAIYVTQGQVLDFEQFIELVEPHAQYVASGKSFRVLRDKLREAGVDFDSFEDTEDDEPDVAGESDDDLYKKMEGKTVAIVGGDRIGSQLEKYKDHFKFGEIIWTSALKSAEVNSIVKQIESGNIQMVFCIVDFCGHVHNEMTRNACKAKGIPFVTVTGGYGLAAFAQSYMRQQGVAV